MNTIQSAPMEKAIRIIPVSSAEQARRIDQTIARRAYEVFERRGGMGWHELEDWRQAESEVRSKLCVGLTSTDDALLVSCNLCGFEEGTVEVWTAPRQMTICGKPIRHKEQAAKAAPLYEGIVFRTIALPVEVEPSRAAANVKRSFVEIRLPMIHPKYGERNRAQAA